jgi:FkbM family methyltransferase
VSDRPAGLPVTWAQHGEDVRLWRVLRDRQPGFYVDVGAMDPDEDSVTKVFYDLGWRGVDVEPDPDAAEELRRARPGDQVFARAASDREGTVTLHRITTPSGERTGLSTLHPELAARHAREGLTNTQVRVRRSRLADLLVGTLAEDPERFHFLKVDAESHEAEVLVGADLERFRPSIVLIEAREPNRATDAYATSETVLSGAGYPFAVDDGINRWYVRKENQELIEVLRPEANPLLDGTPRRAWEVEQERQLRERIDALERANEADEEALEAVRAELEGSRAAAAVLEGDLRALHASRSWRLTAPLRHLSAILRRGTS